GEDDEDGQLDGLGLGSRRRGHQNPETQHGEQERQPEGGEEQDRAPERNAEEDDGGHHAQHQVEEGDEEVGDHLAEDDVDRPQRGDGELLERALLPFPHHTQADDEQAHEEQDEADDAGEHHAARLESRVVQELDPGAGHAVQPAERRLRREQLSAVDEDGGAAGGGD